MVATSLRTFRSWRDLRDLLFKDITTLSLAEKRERQSEPIGPICAGHFMWAFENKESKENLLNLGL